MDKRPVRLIYLGILMNLVLFGAAYFLRLPFLAYHTGTVYVTALLGSTGGILTAIVTFLCLACFVFGPSYAWFMLGAIFISTFVGEQLKKETRTGNWFLVTGEIFLLEAFCHILFTIIFQNSIPHDLLGQSVYYTLLPKMNKVFAVTIAGAVVSLITAIGTVGLAVLSVLCTPKHLLLSQQDALKEKEKKKEKAEKKAKKSEQKSLQSKKNQN